MSVEPMKPVTALEGKTVEEALNKWTTELDWYTTELHRLALPVTEWDQAIMKNGAEIAQQHESAVEVTRIQGAMDELLDYIENQQDSLERVVAKYENEIEKLRRQGLLGISGSLAPADEEREEAFERAEQLNGDLEDMANVLAEVISDVKMTCGAEADEHGDVEDDPVSQIVNILNIHLASLQWIDDETAKLHSVVEEYEQLQETSADSADRSLRGTRTQRYLIAS